MAQQEHQKNRGNIWNRCPSYVQCQQIESNYFVQQICIINVMILLISNLLLIILFNSSISNITMNVTNKNLFEDNGDNIEDYKGNEGNNIVIKLFDLITDQDICFKLTVTVNCEM